MFEEKPILTNIGETLLVRGISGERICFTRFKAGNGRQNETDPMQLMDLHSAQIDFPISRVQRGENDDYMTVSGSFDNESLGGNDLYWRELGLFCAIERTTPFVQQGSENIYQLTGLDMNGSTVYPYNIVSVSVDGTPLTDGWEYNRITGKLTINTAPQVRQTIMVTHPDPQDYLYAYCYDASETGLILSPVSSTRLVQTVDMVITIKGAQIDVLYVGEETDTTEVKNNLSNHINDRNNPHGVTKEQLGLDKVINDAVGNLIPGFPIDDNGTTPSLDTKDSISTLFGKINLVIKRFIAHLTAKNPHKINANDIGAASFVIGYYTGDGKTKRYIDLGFAPKAIILADKTGMLGDDIKGTCGGIITPTFKINGYGFDSNNSIDWNESTAAMIENNGFYVADNYNHKVHTN